MKSIIKSAKTIEEAVQLGLQELGLKREEVEVEVIAEPVKGLFGIFGGNDATVKVKEKEKLKIDIEDIFSNTDYETSINEKEEELEEEIEELEEEIEELEEELEEAFEDFDDNTEDTVIEVEEVVGEIVSSDNKKEVFEENVEKEEIIEKEENAEKEEKTFEVFETNIKTVLNTKDIEFVSEAEIVTDEDDLETVAEKTKKNLENLLVKMHIEAKVSYKTDKDNIINLNLTDISENDTGIVIGSKGETLNAIQYILSLITNSGTNKFYRVTLNVADYRDRRKKSIEKNAQRVAYKVLKTKKSIALKPMNSYERRIVHYALQNYKGIETVSTGKFPNRKVIVKYQEQ